MACRCHTSPGAPDLWARLGWLQGSTRNRMKWGCALSTRDLSQQELLPRVCCTACTKGCTHQNDQIPKNPRLCALEAYIAGDTSHHQPMGTGHITVLRLCGPMGFRVLQWCHPMPACTKRTSYCTWIITLYGVWKVDSGLLFPSPS